MTILVTGGAGYIGSHTCVELLNRGYDVVIIDNLVNSSEKAVARVAEITGKKPAFYKADVRDRAALDRIFETHDIGCAIHFAGLKAVGESVRMPLEYYDNNLLSTVRLCEAMAAAFLRAGHRRGGKRDFFGKIAIKFGVITKKPDGCLAIITEKSGLFPKRRERMH